MDINIHPIQTVMECLSEDYEFIGLVDLKKNEIQGFRYSGVFQTWESLRGTFIPGTRFDEILHELIPQEDLSSFIHSVDRDTLMVPIEHGDKITIPCRIRNSGIRHYAIEFAPNRNDTNFVAIAFRNVEEVVKSRIELEKSLETKQHIRIQLLKIDGHRWSLSVGQCKSVWHLGWSVIIHLMVVIVKSQAHDC